MSKLKATVLAFALAGAAFVAAPNKLYTLDFSSPAEELSFNDRDFWEQTYNAAEQYRTVDFGDEVKFRFSHCSSGFGGDEVGGGMSYWDGFTFSRTADSSDYGAAGSSGTWVQNQWGCMAEGGIVLNDYGQAEMEDDIPAVSPDNTYAVAFWSMDELCNRIDFVNDDEKTFTAKGVYVCAHPWPYYGIEHGDGFARAFTREDDYFKLTVHGLDADGKPNGKSVDYLLAYMEDTSGRGDWQPVQSRNWEWIGLTPLGEVSGVYFTMDSSDRNALFGINTAAYFCLGGMEIESLMASDPSGVREIADSLPATEEWYTLDGLRIDRPSSTGIYIRVRGGQSQKIAL